MSQKFLKMRILIIDDEKELRLTLKEVFEMYGWEADDAENGHQGLKKIEINSYDLVLSDIRMPHATGIDFLEKLSDAYKSETPIVMMSAYSDYSESSLQKLGARKLINKPVSIREIMREIEAFKKPN